MKFKQEVTEKFFKAFKSKMTFPAEVVIAPPFLEGIDFSDHYGFWKNDYPALMITDSAFFRNENYHTPNDLPHTLDYKKMAALTHSLYETIKLFDKKR